MKDTIVTIRMPKSMVEKLAARVDQGHFLDMSEEVRSIIRRQFLKNQPFKKEVEE